VPERVAEQRFEAPFPEGTPGAIPPRWRRHGTRSKLGVWLGLAAFIFVAVAPFFYVVSTSLKTNAQLFTYPPDWIPADPSLGSFERAFDKGIGRWTLNTLFVCTVVAVVKVTFDSMSAYAISKLKFFGRRGLVVTMFATILVPIGVLIIPLYFIVRDLGLLNTYWALILPPLANPIGIFILLGYLSSLPRDLEHAAAIDNCGPWATYRHVILPLIKPGLVVVGIFSFLTQYINFTWPLVAANTDELRMLTTGLASLSLQHPSEQDWGLISAASLLAMVPITLAFLFFQRQFVSASIAGALKE
jgi:ABC-type glycerol-3-phosphate transport system permease component